MNIRTCMVSFIAVLVILVAMSTVIAVDDNWTDHECEEWEDCDDWEDFVTIDEVEVNDVILEDGPVFSGDVDEVLPVMVLFTANTDASDVRVRVYIEGYRDEISVSSDRFHIREGSQYVKKFSIKLPSTFDIDDLSEDVNLVVRISAKNEDSIEEDFDLLVQRNSYSLNILSVDTPQRIVAGSTIAVDFVVENNGNERLDNVYVRASIPELGVERTVYVRDLRPIPEEDLNDIRDTESRRIYLDIPRDAALGNYALEVEAYNYDTNTKVRKNVMVEDVKTEIVPVTTGKTVAVGSETTFDVVLINPSERSVVYTITPSEVSKGLVVEIEEPVVVVPRDSSKTVKVKVRATDSASEGTHVVGVNVNSESGLVKQVKFSVNVDNDSRITSATGTNVSAITVITVILVIIFVVLLIVLIVLLTKKSEEPEEFGETSYY